MSQSSTSEAVSAETAAAAAPPSRFRCQQQMIDAAGTEGLVRIHFLNAPENAPVNYYAHNPLLRCLSGVLKSLLVSDLAPPAEQNKQRAAKVAKATARSTPRAVAAEAAASADADKEQEGCDSSVPVLPMPDEDPTVW